MRYLSKLINSVFKHKAFTYGDLRKAIPRGKLKTQIENRLNDIFPDYKGTMER